MIISRYLIREVITALLAVVVVLLLAFLSQQVVRYLNYVAVGKVPTHLLLRLIGFEVPYLLALLLPLSLYLSILLSYGRLYADNEMAILQMAGFAERSLMSLTTCIAMSVGGVVLLLMMWINPVISAKRQVLMEGEEATLHLIQTLVPGRFQVSPDGRHVMYAEKLSRDHQRAENIFMAKATNRSDSVQNSWMLVLANQGYQTPDKTSGDQFFVTKEGYRYDGTPGQNDYKIIQFKKYAIRIPQNGMRNVHMQEEGLSTLQLLTNYMNPKHAAEFQWRISIGISALVLAFLAVPFSRVRPRHGRYLVLFPAVLIYIVYINLLFVSRHWVEQGAVPISLGMWWVHGLFLLLISLILFKKSQGWAVK